MADSRFKRKQETHPYHLRAKVDPVSKDLDNSIVKLEPDVAEAFPDAASVNEALRWLIQDSKENSTVPPHINKNA